MARVELVTARFCAQRGNAREAAAAVERARAHAATTEQQALKAEVETWSAHLLNTSWEIARASWAVIGDGLADPLRAAFYAHPLRRAVPEARFDELTRPDRGRQREQEPPREIDGLRQLLALYRQLNRERRVDAVLESALDAAIDLTRAERGFLILSDPSKTGGKRWSVPVAKNFDREELKGPRQKFSHSIARRAVNEREPVLVVDAGRDQRFSHEKSIGVLNLRSVLAVPLIADDQALGAIYVDNRFTDSGFDGEHVRLLVAFADQLAIALTKARLLEELEQRTRELEVERARVAELLSSKEREVEELTRQLDTSRMHYDFQEIIGRSEPMRAVFARLERVVESSVTVLIGGESGTGKELVARALHANGPRCERPFVAINCGALPAALLEAELFGYKKGAFTGANDDREGLFVAAHGGTLFLDEIGELRPELQVKLLRALQESEVRPLGSATTVPVDVRVICATHRNLEREVAEQRFREDLYYRIAVVTVTLPPLRERAGDIPQLAHSILARVAKSQNRLPPPVSAAAMRALQAHAWPGNVRELENVLTHALLFAEGPKIMPEDLELRSLTKQRRVRRKPGPAEAQALRAALEAMGDNRLLAAQALGMSRATFYRRLARYGIDRR
jgi:transcriptional regulator with GAF, ATPase, and Fis domain